MILPFGINSMFYMSTLYFPHHDRLQFATMAGKRPQTTRWQKTRLILQISGFDDLSDTCEEELEEMGRMYAGRLLKNSKSNRHHKPGMFGKKMLRLAWPKASCEAGRED